MLSRFKIALLVFLLGVCADHHSLIAAPPEVEKLIMQLSDKDALIRLKAAKELGKLKQKAKDALPSLKNIAESDSDQDVRSVAKNALDSIQLDSFDEKLAPMIKNLKSKDIKVRLAAIANLEQMGSNAKPAGAILVEYGVLNPNATINNAALAALEKIDSIVYKDIVTIIYDKDETNKVKAVNNLKILGLDAKSAVPAIKRYHYYYVNKNKYIPEHTLEALKKISPDDEELQKLILTMLAGPRSELPGESRYEYKSRTFVFNSMLKMNIDDKIKYSAIISSLMAMDANEIYDSKILIDDMKSSLEKLKLSNKDKYDILMSAISKGGRVFYINKLAELGNDAKGALPVLQKFKTDSNEAVRSAANKAIDAINK